MNLNAEDSFFTQHCLELAKLLRTEQTEDFLRLYDSLPSEWTGLRKLNEEYLQLEAAKEYIRQLQELDENDFQLLYRRAFSSRETHQTIIMSNVPRQQQQSTVLHNETNDGEPIITSNSRITSLPILQQKQHIERQTANNLACDEKHDISMKHSSSIKRNSEETSAKTRRLQPITNNNNTHDMMQTNCRTETAVDSFVQLNLKPAIDITVEDYKKTRISMPSTKNSGSNHRSIDINESNQKDITQSIYLKKSKTSMETHEEASFDYFSKNNDDDEDEDEDENDDQQHSRSPSPSSSTSSSTPNPYAISANNETDLSINQRSNSSEHGKLISSNGFDSHGSSIATKSSSNNSGSARTASCSDSDGEHNHHQQSVPPPLPTKSLFQLTKSNPFNDNITTMVLSQTSDYRPSQYDRISPLPKQDSYELVQLNTENNERHVLASQIARLKLSATDDPSDINHSNNDTLSYTTPRTQQNNTTSTSSHQNRNNDHPEQYNTNHSNSSRKPSSRTNKKRKQPQNQETIRTELIPGHRGDRDVDELVMFIDGHSSPKQRQNSAPLRPTDTNKFKSIASIPDSNSNHQSKSRRKSRKPIKILPESLNNHENKSATIDDETQSIGYIDEDDDTTTTTTHSIPSAYHSLPNDEESHSNTLDLDSNRTNGETSLPEWLEPTESTSPAHDDTDSFSLSSTTLNNSNSEITSEPFVTVTHRRRLTKERRQDNHSSAFGSQSSRLISSSSHTNDKRRFPPSSTTHNGNPRPTIRNTLSNIKPFVSIPAPKEENIASTSSQAISQPSVPSLPNNSTEQSPPHLSSHSSSSSLVSSVKRQSKPPPVVFLNKSVDIELNDVSFGFDVENDLLDKPSTPPPPPPPPPVPVEKETAIETESLSPTQSTSSKSSFPSRRSYQNQQRNTRGPLFYSGTDIRPPHPRNYSSQPPVSQSSYIDPYLFLQYNQQRYAANYSPQLAYINLVRAQYLSSQSPYILIPTAYPEDKLDGDENTTNQPSESIQEPLLVYATLPTQPGSIYLQPTKKSYHDLEHSSQPAIPTIYPSQYFYSTQTPQMIPSHPAYFQPIPSTSLIDTKSQPDNTDDDEDEHQHYARTFHQTRQQSSSHIMSNALQLVYSQEKRNTQTDCFNLDQLTAYLAMKWTENIDHYEKGDDEILLVEEES